MTSTDQDLTAHAIEHEQHGHLETAQIEIDQAARLVHNLQGRIASYTKRSAPIIAGEARHLAQVVTQLNQAVGALATLAQVAPRD